MIVGIIVIADLAVALTISVPSSTSDLPYRLVYTEIASLNSSGFGKTVKF